MNETSTPFNKEPLLYGQHNGGHQYVFSFDNGYGASVIQSYISYGNEEGLWELAVITFNEDKSDWNLTYRTPITDDVIGSQTVEEINALLTQIEQLPSIEKEGE